MLREASQHIELLCAQKEIEAQCCSFDLLRQNNFSERACRNCGYYPVRRAAFAWRKDQISNSGLQIQLLLTVHSDSASVVVTT